MARRKTQESDASVEDFVRSISDPAKKSDCRTLVDLFSSATDQEPRMWGASIVGFGKHHYNYANGEPAEICKIGFAPRARSFAFYMANFPGRETLIDNLGRHSFSGGCLHIKRLAGIDLDILKRMAREAYYYEGRDCS